MTDDTLNEIISRILDKVSARKIILFGSRAKGTNRNDSDYDLLVLCDDNTDIKKISKEIYTQFIGIAKGIDVIIRPEKYIEQSAQEEKSFISSILKEGKVVYG